MKPAILLCAIFLSLLITSCSDSPEAYTPEKQTIRFVEMSHGLAKKADLSTEENGLSSDGEQADDFSVAKTVDTIEAKQGVRFGIRYTLESNQDMAVSLRQVWIFPDSMRDEEGGVFKEVSRELNTTPNEETFASYQLDYPYEVMRGKWQLRFYYKNHLLYRKIFVLI
jgi:hypothetical protein